ncbi:hypothetical protein [uncultured Vagococcus sp.]|uniref:hypothetical protein n=1 Tax=uncultured Vagococcus sp. TaxID=189676 RepID=UPI0028D16968|nr:hypothetical protein [uncultured Vagococcus sp.]
MTIDEFTELMESLMSTKDSFYIKFTERENNLNDQRMTAQQWNETQIERAVDKQWKLFMGNIYDQVATKVKVTTPADKGWLEFITAEEFISSFDESIHEMTFDD